MTNTHAIFEYIEGFRKRRLRHSAVDWLTPMEFGTTVIARAPLLNSLCRNKVMLTLSVRRASRATSGRLLPSGTCLRPGRAARRG